MPPERRRNYPADSKRGAQRERGRDEGLVDDLAVRRTPIDAEGAYPLRDHARVLPWKRLHARLEVVRGARARHDALDVVGDGERVVFGEIRGTHDEGLHDGQHLQLVGRGRPRGASIGHRSQRDRARESDVGRERDLGVAVEVSIEGSPRRERVVDQQVERQAHGHTLRARDRRDQGGRKSARPRPGRRRS